MAAYYNEHDKFAAAWLRELIKRGVIADGEVDERDIQLVRPEDLRGFVQCHFFAGIGVWSYALRSAGWPDSKRVWTGSCPCQPFSICGDGDGASDERHLWPVWFPLIRESRPELVFGEQVASDSGLAWLDLVHADLEGQGYTVGAVDTCAAGVGAPHIRQRIYFCADAADARRDDAGQHGSRPSLLPARLEQRSTTLVRSDAQDAEVRSRSGEVSARTRKNEAHGSGDGCEPVRRSNASGERRQQERGSASRHEEENGRARWNGSEPDGDHFAAGNGEVGECLHAESANGRLPVRRRRQNQDPAEPPRPSEARNSSDSARRGLGVRGGASRNGGQPALADETLDRRNTEQSGLERLSGDEREWRGSGWLDPAAARSVAAAGATRGFWKDCDWWYGRDGKFRPIEPGIFPLAHGAAKRVGRLRGYGNAINAEQAKAFITAYCEVREGVN